MPSSSNHTASRQFDAITLLKQNGEDIEEQRYKDYREVGRIGEGTFGVVCHARHVPTGRAVALKKIRIRQTELSLFESKDSEFDSPLQSARSSEKRNGAATPPFGGKLIQQQPAPQEPIQQDEFRRQSITKINDLDVFDFPLQALREYKSLEHLRGCPYVVELLEAFAHGSNLVLVLERMDTDLSQFLQNRHIGLLLDESVTKCLLQMLLRGIDHCHRNNIIHRDIKPANLLLSESSGLLKLGDFGLAIPYKPQQNKDLSHMVATRWYRAPELLYGSRRYDHKIDMWSVGCVFAEILNGGSPLFPGENDIDQLRRVIQVLGTPTPQNWPGVEDLPDYGKIIFNGFDQGIPLSSLVPNASSCALDLLSRLLCYCSSKRLDAREALNHVYFRTEPYPCHPRYIAALVTRSKAAASSCSAGTQQRPAGLAG